MSDERVVKLQERTVQGAQLSPLAYDKIKRDILACTFRPGVVLSESMLCERYTLGKAPIRTALTRLAHDGLVIAERRRGYRVTPITIKDIQEIFQLRLMIEPEAAHLAAGKLTNDTLETLHQSCSMHTPQGHRKSDTEFLQSNRLFHLTIAKASGNARLAHWVSQLLDDVERMLHLGLISENKGDQFQEEHLQLLELLLTNQPEQAAQMVRDQLKGGLLMVVNSMLKSPELLAVPNINTVIPDTR